MTDMTFVLGVGSFIAACLMLLCMLVYLIVANIRRTIKERQQDIYRRQNRKKKNV